MSPHRAIDLPLEELPAIDEHGLEIEASAEDAWDALLVVLHRSFNSRLAIAAARRLKCEETDAHGPDFDHPGGTVPGFVVSRSVPPVMLAMLGEHRFASYALVFRLDITSETSCRLRAETRADFPGLKGTIYRRIVIGTQGHVLVVMRMLKAVKKLAESKSK